MNNRKIKRTPFGQWKYPHEPTIVPTPTGKITMEGLDYPVLGIDNLGNSEMMLPGNNYKFPGNEVLELPVNKFQDGSQLPPIQVDPNDPAGRNRYKAYQDSLNLYNRYIDHYNMALNINPGTREQVARRYNILQSPSSQHLYHLIGTNHGGLGSQYMHARNTNNVNPNILPIAARSYADESIARISRFLAEYKKPTQPVKYKPNPEIVAKQQQLIDAGYNIGTADGIWGSKSKKAWEEYQNSLNSQNVNPSVLNTNIPEPQQITPVQNQQRLNLIVTPDGRHLRVTGDEYNRMLNRGNRATQGINYKYGGRIKFQNGGNLENNNFEDFVKTLPDNLKQTGPEYNLRGLWETVGSPKSFLDVKDGEDFPLQDDGLYHGFSVGNNGNWLKSKQHPSAWMEYLYGYQLNPENNKNFNVTPNIEGHFGENQLQYVPKKYGGKIKYQSGGNFNMRQGSGESDYSFWDGLGSFAYGALQGTIGTIPGVGAALTPALEAGRKGLQSLAGNTGKAEDDIIAGVGGITGAVGTSIATGNPMGALGGSEQGINKITSTFDKAQNLDKLSLFKKGGNMKKRTSFYQMGGDMGLTEYEGLSHDEGGLPIPGRNAEVEGGETMVDDYVFSDSLQVPGKKKTFAQESKAIKNKYNLRKGDPLSQEVVNEGLQELMQLQESLKKDMASKKMNEALELDPTILDSMMQGQPSMEEQMSMQQGMPQEMPMSPEGMSMEGMPMMKKGGRFKKYQYSDLLDPVTEFTGGQGFDWLNMPKQTEFPYTKPVDLEMMPVQNINSGIPNLSEFLDDEMPYIDATASNRKVPRLPNRPNYGKVRNINIPPYDSPGDTLEDDSDITLSEFEQSKLPMRLMQGLNAVGPIANFIAAGAGRQPRLTRNQNFIPTSSRPAEMLLESSNNRALATGRNALRDAAPNQQSFLTNTTATTSKVSENIGKGISNLRFRNDLTNIQNKQNIDLQNINNQTANNLLLDSSDANRWNLALQGVQGLQEGMQQGLMDEMMMDSDLLKIALSSTPNYRYDIDNKGGKRRIRGTYRNPNKKPLTTTKTKEN